MIRHQPPVYSPLPLPALIGALAGGPLRGEDPRDALSALLAKERRANRAVLYGSGTQALQVALRVAVDSVGGDVALPAYSCFDVATAAVAAQVSVRFYDVEPRTLGPDLASLEAALAGGARVVVAGPLYGIPLDWAPVQEIVRRHGAVLVEDAAQSHGCRTGGYEAGMFGDLSILSFGRGKGWTGGAGGALLVHHKAAHMLPPSAGKVASADGAGITIMLKSLAQWAFGRPALYGAPSAIPWLGLGETHYREPLPVARMCGRAAALSLRTRGASLTEAEHRRSAANLIRSGFEEAGLIPDPIQVVSPPRDAVAGYLRLPVLLPLGIEGFPSARRAEALGLSPGYPRSLPELAPLRAFHAHTVSRCPGAELLAKRLVTVPVHSHIRGADRALIIKEMGLCRT